MATEMRISETSPNQELVQFCRLAGSERPRQFTTSTGLSVLITVDAGLMHMSVSHQSRYPTWDELKHLRYKLLPDAKTFAILFPPAAQYVNVHPNCFHLHEVPEMGE